METKYNLERRRKFLFIMTPYQLDGKGRDPSCFLSSPQNTIGVPGKINSPYLDRNSNAGAITATATSIFLSAYFVRRKSRRDDLYASEPNRDKSIGSRYTSIGSAELACRVRTNSASSSDRPGNSTRSSKSKTTLRVSAETGKGPAIVNARVAHTIRNGVRSIMARAYLRSREKVT